MFLYSEIDTQIIGVKRFTFSYLSYFTFLTFLFFLIF